MSFSTMKVSDALIDQMDGEWSMPVEFRFVRQKDGTVEMEFRHIPLQRARPSSCSPASTRETR